MSTIRDIQLKDEGHRRIHWAQAHMPVLGAIGDRFEKEKPFQGMDISLAIHLEAKTACLVKTLIRGGANVYVTGSNPMSTQDSVCAALVDDGITVHAIHGTSQEETQEYWKRVLTCHPHVVIDDGADLIHLLLSECSDYADRVLGACEETTSGVQRLHGWEKQEVLTFPTIAVNDARCKSFFDNTYGTGQSVWDALMRTTNLQINGKQVVIAGYGFCGRGIAHVAKGLGARVIITEADPVRAVQAMMDGFRALPMAEAAPIGDIFITVTASRDVIRPEHFALMKDYAIIANAGHFNVELDMEWLEKNAVKKSALRHNLDGYQMADGRTLVVVGAGGLVNISAGDGNPMEIMDMSFALQALAAERIALHGKEMEPKVHRLPKEVDDSVAITKLATMGGGYDQLNSKQLAYMAGLARD